MPDPNSTAAPETALHRGAAQRAWDALQLGFWRVAASGWLPARWFNEGLPAEDVRAARTGRLQIEVVSHCWRYAHLLAYQLSSLVHVPPRDVDVTMTVFHAREDASTVALLDHFASIQLPHVRWNWQVLPKERLFRRAIGRNLAAKDSRADWVWFTDCDLMFREGCLDTLGAQLQGRRDALVFPRVERVTALLAEDDPRLQFKPDRLVDIDGTHFEERMPGRATGPLQITHGDVARALGYCEPIAFYQQPVEHWAKAHEDRAHRWLVESQGAPIEVPGVYRIRHVFKGRYAEDSKVSTVRGWLRKRMG